MKICMLISGEKARKLLTMLSIQVTMEGPAWLRYCYLQGRKTVMEAISPQIIMQVKNLLLIPSQTLATENLLIGTKLEIASYPADVEVRKGYMYRDEGTVRTGGYLLKHTVQTAGGNSGSTTSIVD